MKKSLYTMFAAAALLGFAACDDGTYNDWADPIVNPQDEVAAAANVSVSATGTLVDYATELGENVKLFSLSGNTVSKVEVEFSNGTVLSADANGNVKADELKSVVEAIYGKAPVERELDATVIAYVNVDGAVVKAKSPIVIKAQLTAPQISENYYIVGGTLDWAGSAASKEQKFIHSDKSVYDDPVFSIVFPASAEGDTWFAIGDDEACDAIANENDWSKLFGTTSGNGNSGEEGFLARRYELSDDGSFKVDNGSKFIKVEINMMDASYTVKALNFEKYLWVPGNAQGWNPAAAGRIVSENYDGIYEGYIYVDGGFKFTSAPDWDHTNYGTGDAEGTVSAVGGDFSWEAGVYYVTVNLVDMTVSSTKVEKMGLIGDFNGWGDDALLEWDAAHSCFRGDASMVTEAGWKFRVNADWGLNLGGTLDNLSNNGANLSATGNVIELFPLRLEGVNDNIYAAMDGETPDAPVAPEVPTDLPAYLWVPGNAQGWSPESAGRIVGNDGVYEGFIYVDGGFKFTAAADWSHTNYGVGDEDGTISATGGDFSWEAGVYYVKVNLLNNTYTSTKIQNMNLVGDFNGWNASDDAQQMTWNASESCYEITGAGVNESGWKFTANNSWDINLGGALDNLVANGGNLEVSGSSIKLYPLRLEGVNENIVCTVE